MKKSTLLRAVLFVAVLFLGSLLMEWNRQNDNSEVLQLAILVRITMILSNIYRGKRS